MLVPSRVEHYCRGSNAARIWRSERLLPRLEGLERLEVVDDLCTIETDSANGKGALLRMLSLLLHFKKIFSSMSQVAIWSIAI